MNESEFPPEEQELPSEEQALSLDDTAELEPTTNEVVEEQTTDELEKEPVTETPLEIPSAEMSMEELMDSSATIPLGLWQDEVEEEPIRAAHEIVLNRLPYIRTTSICHVGAVRERNDDSCLVFESQVGGHFKMMPFGLYIVADGMGGHANGHMASKVASRVASHEIVENIYLPLLQDTSGGSPTPIQEVLVNAGQKANTAVYEVDIESDSGTTLTGVLLLGQRLYALHVGDSRAYIYTDGELEQITTDHSLVQRLQEVGQLTEDEAAFYQYRHVLLRAVGQADEVDVDTYMRRLPKNGRLLLCSDGLCSMINDKEIHAVMAKEDGLDNTAEELFTAAIEAGGHDNITIILVDFAF